MIGFYQIPTQSQTQYVETYKTLSESSKCTVVWLTGTGSCGKSSLGKAIEQLDPTWQYVDQDVYFIQEVEKELEKRFPDQCQRIKKCAGSLGLFQVLKKLDGMFSASEEDKQDAHNALAEIEAKFTDDWMTEFKASTFPKSDLFVLQEVQEAVKKGKNVLLNAWGITCEKIQALNPHIQIFHGLMYTPLERSFEFLKMRNEKAIAQNDLKMQRFSGTLFSSFESLYAFCQMPTDRTIDVVSYKNLSTFFDETEKKLKPVGNENFLFWYEISLAHFRALRDTLLADKEESKTLYLQPKATYDFILKEKGTPEERAQSLLNEIKKLEENASKDEEKNTKTSQ